MGRAAFVPASLTLGPFSGGEARERGLTEDQLRGASWRRLARDLYAWREIAGSPRIRLAAALRRLPREAVVSGLTAAWLHGLDYPPCDPIEVTVPRRNHTSSLQGISIRRCRLEPEEVVLREAMQVTSPLRTVADLACRLELVESVVLVDAALHAKLVSLAQLERWAAAHRGRRGVRRLGRALDLAEPATESPMETRLRLLLVLHGLPRPAVQPSLYDDGGAFLGRPDLYYPDSRVAIEYDGAVHRLSLAADNRRQNRLIDGGHRVLRFTASDVLNTPIAVVSLVRRAILVKSPR